MKKEEGDLSVFSSAAIKTLLARYHKHPSKALGENYLIAKPVAENIAALALKPAASGKSGEAPFLFEVGAGLGGLTQCLLAGAAPVRVLAVELEKRSFEILKARFPNAPAGVSTSVAARQCYAKFLKEKTERLFLLRANGLECDFENDFPLPAETGLISNLPYSCATKLVVHFLERYGKRLSKLVVMTQREVGERWLARPKQKNAKQYGIASVLLAYHAILSKAFLVPPQAFFPRPKVMSLVLEVYPNRKTNSAPPLSGSEYGFFKTFVKAAFQKRRATLKTALLKNNVHRFEAARLAASLAAFPNWQRRRAEEVQPEEFLKMALACVKKLNGL